LETGTVLKQIFFYKEINLLIRSVSVIVEGSDLTEIAYDCRMRSTSMGPIEIAYVSRMINKINQPTYQIVLENKIKMFQGRTTTKNHIGFNKL
jgi:hypothetical protein